MLGALMSSTRQCLPRSPGHETSALEEASHVIPGKCLIMKQSIVEACLQL